MVKSQPLPVAWADSRTILIGCSEFDDPALNNIPASARSLKAIHGALTELCHLQSDNVRVIDNPRDVQSLGSEIADAAEAVTGVLFLYFVGHGLLSNDGELYLAVGSTDARVNRLSYSAIRYATIRQTLLNSGARCTVVVLDCCFSGRAINTLSSASDEAPSAARIDGVCVITASADDQAALILPDGSATAFSNELVGLLRNGVIGGPPVLTVRKVFQSLLASLPSKGFPQPRATFSQSVESLPLFPNAAHPDETTIGAKPTIPAREVSAAIPPYSTSAVPPFSMRYGSPVRPREDRALDAMTASWPEIVKRLRDYNRPTNALIQTCSLERVSGSKVVLSCPTSMIRDQLDRKDRAVHLLRAITSVFPHVSWSVSFLGSGTQSSGRSLHSVRATLDVSPPHGFSVTPRLWPKTLAKIRELDEPSHLLCQNALFFESLINDIYLKFPTAALAAQMRLPSRGAAVEKAFKVLTSTHCHVFMVD